MKSIRLGLVLAWVGVLSLLLTACSPITELPIEKPVPVDPIDKLTRKLQLTDEQLQTLKTGTGTLEFRKDQVDRYRKPVEELRNEVGELFDEPQQAEIILDRLLKGEADLQALAELAEDLHKRRETAGVQVVTSLQKVSDEVVYSTEKSHASRVITVYTPGESTEGNKHFNLHDRWGNKIGPGKPHYRALASPDKGLLYVESGSWIGSDRGTALLGIKFSVPADNTDVNITTTMKYNAATWKFMGAAATTSIATWGGTQLNTRYKVIDPIIDWKQWGLVICDAVAVAAPGLRVACYGGKNLVYVLEGLKYEQVKTMFRHKNMKGLKERKIQYDPGTLDKGTYKFHIGLHVRTSSLVAGYALANAAGYLTKIEVSSPNHEPTVRINSPTSGATFSKGESIPFNGEATDPEDGRLSGESLVWTSSIDGQIGTGESFTRSDLSVGTHIITLTATDSGGKTGTSQVEIVVEETELFVEDFEDDPAGSIPTGWKKHSWSGCPDCGIVEVTDEKAAEGNQSLYVFEDKLSNVTSARHFFSSPRKVSSVSLYMRFNPEGLPRYGGAESLVQLREDNNGILTVGFVTGERLGTSKQLAYWVGPKDEDIRGIQPINPNKWYLLELKNINYQESTYDIYLDGTLVKENAPFYQSTEGITSIWLQSDESRSYFDDVIAYGKK